MWCSVVVVSTVIVASCSDINPSDAERDAGQRNQPRNMTDAETQTSERPDAPTHRVWDAGTRDAAPADFVPAPARDGGIIFSPEPPHRMGFQAVAQLEGVGRVVAGDITGDGRPELYYTHRIINAANDLREVRGVTFPRDVRGIVEVLRITDQFTPLVVGDIDGNGISDLIGAATDTTSSRPAYRVTVYRSPVSGSPPTESRWFTLGPHPIHALAFADLDGHGGGEAIAAAPFHAFGIVSSVLTLVLQKAELNAIGEVTAGDIDRDGAVDLVIGVAGSPGRVMVYERTGPDFVMRLAWETTVPIDAPQWSTGPADSDGDGRLEFLVGGKTEYADGLSRWWFGLFEARGDDRYERIHAIEYWGEGAGGGAVATGDTDGDGRAEYAVSHGDTIHLFVAGSRDRLIETFSGGLAGTPTVPIVYADLDADGRDELVLTAGDTGLPQIITILQRVE